MKKLLLATLFALSISGAQAASVTVPPGTIELVIVTPGGTVVATPSATIDAPTETAFVLWCQSKYIGSAAASTVAGCIGVWFDDWVNQSKASMLATSQAGPSAAAAAAVTPPAITPTQ